MGAVSLGSQYAAALYMGAESPAIIGSLLSIIVIVIAARFVKGEKVDETADQPKSSVGELLNA